MRLSTYNNYAFHVGNKLESWMIEVQKGNEKNIKRIDAILDNVEQSPDLFNSERKNKVFGFKKMIIKKMFNFFIMKNRKIDSKIW